MTEEKYIFSLKSPEAEGRSTAKLLKEPGFQRKFYSSRQKASTKATLYEKQNPDSEGWRQIEPLYYCM